MAAPEASRAASASGAAVPVPPPPPAGGARRASAGRGSGPVLLAAAGPLSAVAAAVAVATGVLTAPTALLGLALLGAAAAILRALLEPAAGGLPPLAQALALIRGRRAIFPRDFSGAKLERWQIEAMLEAARWAPTHKKTEPWRFVVLGGQAKGEFEALTIKLCRERLPADKAEATVAKLERKAGKDWKSVSNYIAICMKRHADQLPEWEEVAAVSCAVQNAWLAATAAGVACYWSSWQEAARTAPEMLEFLGMEPGDQCLGFIVAGVAEPGRAEGYKAARRPLEAIAEWRL